MLYFFLMVEAENKRQKKGFINQTSCKKQQKK